MCEFKELCACMGLCGGRRSILGVLLSEPFTLLFETGSLTGTWFSVIRLVSGHWVPRIFLSLPLSTGTASVCHHAWLYMWVLGIMFMSYSYHVIPGKPRQGTAVLLALLHVRRNTLAQGSLFLSLISTLAFCFSSLLFTKNKQTINKPLKN